MFLTTDLSFFFQSQLQHDIRLIINREYISHKADGGSTYVARAHRWQLHSIQSSI